MLGNESFYSVVLFLQFEAIALDLLKTLKSSVSVTWVDKKIVFYVHGEVT